MRKYIPIVFLLVFRVGFSQAIHPKVPSVNVRLSVLIFPFSPLLTLEVKMLGETTVQLETNFKNTHGVNLKYYLKDSMDKDFLFIGTALVKNKLLRQDLQLTLLPYLGYGYAYRFGKSKNWILDNRFGIGITTNSDNNGLYPILKTGIGRTF